MSEEKIEGQTTPVVEPKVEVPSFSEDDLKNLQADINAAKEGLAAGVPAKEEPVVAPVTTPNNDGDMAAKVAAQVLASLKAEEANKQAIAAEAAKVKSLESAQQHIDKLQKQLSDLTASKQVVNMKSPFESAKDGKPVISDAKEREIDEASLRAFWHEKSKHY